MEKERSKRFNKVKKIYETYSWNIDSEDKEQFLANISKTNSLLTRSKYSFKIDSECVERIVEPKKIVMNKFGVFFIIAMIFIFGILYFFIN